MFKKPMNYHELPISKLSVVKDFKMSNDMVKIIYRII